MKNLETHSRSADWDFLPRKPSCSLAAGQSRLSPLFLRVCSVEHPTETFERNDGASQELAVCKSVKGREEEGQR